ncbi:MAG TPA: ABC transporter ATP-binding protein, partial [Ktedonobacterales bacterium]|nr:ABC transporter ATP-binding protein [Ktedonobacterales bacterium]
MGSSPQPLANTRHDVAGASQAQPGPVPLLAVRDVSMRYAQRGGGSLAVLDGVSLTLRDGELVALIGPSGCGKSTLLAILAGLEAPTAGSIVVRGDTNAQRLGRFGYMPQRDLLLPWRSALGNAMAGLEAQGVRRAEARERARALFGEFGLAGFERAYPPQLSGGMRQRVAFARTVLAGGELLLLDEPFGALDALTRGSLQRWLLDLWERLGRACLLVTHDVDEALLLADRVYALSPRPGRVLLERTVSLPRPRRREQLLAPQMQALRLELLTALEGEDEGRQFSNA